MVLKSLIVIIYAFMVHANAVAELTEANTQAQPAANQITEANKRAAKADKRAVKAADQVAEASKRAAEADKRAAEAVRQVNEANNRAAEADKRAAALMELIKSGDLSDTEKAAAALTLWRADVGTSLGKPRL